MPQTKTPTSSLSVIELLVKRAWYRILAKIWRILCLGEVSLETSTTYRSPATRLPLEVVEIFIAYLTYDIRSLRACTLTCYSWYIAAVPHLYYNLELTVTANSRDRRFRWPNPIRHLSTLGLLPLVKRFCIYHVTNGNDVRLSPTLFNCRILRQFSALTNVQELKIEYLDISDFMPRIQRYFGHFSSTVKSLVLREPRGSRRQIIYFIGLFQHLQNLTLSYNRAEFQEEPTDDLTLLPPFVPPLQGYLMIRNFTRVGLLKDMIDLFEGIRFRYMLLHNVDGMRLLLGASVKTLDTLKLYPADPRGEQLPFNGVRALVNDLAVKSSLQDFDLSRHKLLRTLVFPASDINRVSNDGLSDAASSFIQHVLSTITSSAPLKIIVGYYDSDFGVKPDWPYLRETSQADIAEEASRHHRLFQVFREARKVRDFQLALYATVWGCVGEHNVRKLERAVAEEKARGGFDNSLSEPLVRYDPQRFRTHR